MKQKEQEQGLIVLEKKKEGQGFQLKKLTIVKLFIIILFIIMCGMMK